MKAVEGRLIEPGIAYVKIRVFSTNTDASLLELLEQLSGKSKALKGMVLDLRRNPGGLLDQGIRVADRFICEGLIVKTIGKGGQVMDEARATRRNTWEGFPMVTLVDGATASAAEIVAGALQDHGRSVILGTQSFGKGSVQTVIDVDGCGSKPCGLKLTVARYYTPNGRSIQGQGITPDIVVDATRHRPTPRTPSCRASATCTSGSATSRATSRPSPSGWRTTSCRWRWTTCTPGRSSPGRSRRSSAARPAGRAAVAFHGQMRFSPTSRARARSRREEPACRSEHPPRAWMSISA